MIMSKSESVFDQLSHNKHNFSNTSKDLLEFKLYLGRAVVLFLDSWGKTLLPVPGAQLHAQPAPPPQAASPEPFLHSSSTHFSIIMFPEMFPKSLANSSSHDRILSHSLAVTAHIHPVTLSLPNKWTHISSLPRNSEFPCTNLSHLGHCPLPPGLLPQLTSLRSPFLDFQPLYSSLFIPAHWCFLLPIVHCWLWFLISVKPHRPASHGKVGSSSGISAPWVSQFLIHLKWIHCLVPKPPRSQVKALNWAFVTMFHL